MDRDKSIEKAVNWWAEKITNGCLHDNGARDASSVFACMLADIGAKNIEKQQVDIFKKELTRIIKGEEQLLDIWLSCDYGPGVLLGEAAEIAGINPLNFPFKTNLIIKSDGKVLVSDGYGKSYIEI